MEDSESGAFVRGAHTVRGLYCNTRKRSWGGELVGLSKTRRYIDGDDKFISGAI
jgi:hypothetical protein